MSNEFLKQPRLINSALFCFREYSEHHSKIKHILLSLEQTVCFGRKIEGYFPTDLLFPPNQA